MNTIKLGSNVRVSDPCYTDDVWCKTRLTNVLPGEYSVHVDHSDRLGWGRRVSRLMVSRIGSSVVKTEVRPGEIGVDSGQAGIFSEETYRNDQYASENIPHIIGEQWSPGTISRDKEGDDFYDRMCSMTINSEDSFNVYPEGVVSSSGYGDGGYDLILGYDSNNQIVFIEIVFINEEEDEEEEDEWDEDDLDPAGGRGLHSHI